jgi:hypothetical protein
MRRGEQQLAGVHPFSPPDIGRPEIKLRDGNM